PVGNFHFIVLCQSISNFNSDISRIALIPVRTEQGKSNTLRIRLLYFPQSLVIKVQSAVQVVSIFICVQAECLSTKFKRSPRNSVCVSADSCAKETCSCLISGHIVVSEYYIPFPTVFVHYHNVYKGCTIVGYFQLHSIFIF